MSKTSRLWQILKLVIYLSVVLLATFFLGIATYESLKFGPKSGAITLILYSITIENLYVSASQRLFVSWNADLVFINRKSELNVKIPPFNAFLTYDGIPIACGFMNDTLRIDVGKEKSFKLYGNALRCEWGRLFMLGPHAADLATDLKRKKVDVGIEMSVGAYYKHSYWGWDVMIKPSCENMSIKIENDQGKGRLDSVGSKACKVPQPLWYH